MIRDFGLSRQLNPTKSSRAISRVSCLYETDVSSTISVSIIRDLVPVSYTHLTSLIAREDFIRFSRRETFRSYRAAGIWD